MKDKERTKHQWASYILQRSLTRIPKCQIQNEFLMAFDFNERCWLPTVFVSMNVGNWVSITYVIGDDSLWKTELRSKLLLSYYDTEYDAK